MKGEYDSSTKYYGTAQIDKQNSTVLTPSKNIGMASTLSPAGSSSSIIDNCCDTISETAGTISESELISVLNKIMREVKRINAQKRLPIINDVLSVLRELRTAKVQKIAHHDFFTFIQPAFLESLQQWSRSCDLTDDQARLLRMTIRLLHSIFKNDPKIDFQPSWLFESASLSIVANCITELSKPDRFVFEKTAREAKQFARLFEMFVKYQKKTNEEENGNKEALFPLLEPVVNTLSSTHYTDSFDKMHNAAKLKMSKKEKFFLLKCPSFLLSYRGASLERMLNTLLSQMIPKYSLSFNKLIPVIEQWKPPTFNALEHFLKIAELGSVHANVQPAHLPFTGQLIKLVDSPTLYNNIEDSLSNPQSIMLATIISSFANIIEDPRAADYFKEKKAAPIFIRLLHVKNESLQNKLYKIIAYTANEDAIKTIPHIDDFVSKILFELKPSPTDSSEDSTRVLHFLPVFQNLVHHDQIKKEVVKQGGLPHVLSLTNEHKGETLVKLLETIWSMSFSPEAAEIIRSNEGFKKKVEEMAKTTNDEALKKASQGLVWKLIQEPAFLEKAAKKKEESVANGEEEVSEVVIGDDGKETIVTKKKYSVVQSTEQQFKYDMMISYCHADKEIVYKIHKFLLEQGFKIWIDLNNMFGPAMSAMAEAVESSEFVLLCMSPSYKQSTYCQAEAEYAFGCKRRLIPLIIRPKYKADGWLGFMIGSRIYIDYGTFDFDTACDKLMNEISLQRKRPLPSKTGQTTTEQEKPPEPAPGPAPGPAPKSAPKPVRKPAPELKNAEKPTEALQLSDQYTKRKIEFNFKTKPINLWSESDVLDFLFHNRLVYLMPLCETMDGRALKQLYKMCGSQTNETYTLLNAELQSLAHTKLPIGTYTQFLSIMEQVTQPIRPPAIPRQPVVKIMPVQQKTLPYDIIITTDAPATQVLKMAERILPQLIPATNGHQNNGYYN